VRQNERDKVFAVINFSAAMQNVSCEESLYHGTYLDYFSDQQVVLNAASRFSLLPWGYRVFVK
jgi:hypothetical protein